MAVDHGNSSSHVHVQPHHTVHTLATPVAQTAALAAHHVAHTPVAHVVHAPVAHVAHHAPVVHSTAPVTYGVGGGADSETYPDETIPYSYQYTVADPESGSNYSAEESDDGTGVRSGSYSVALPDSRTQHVTYTTDDVNGYVATVTYDGTAVYPEK